LTVGSIPDQPVMKLIEGLQTVMPIISVKTGTFETSNTIGHIHSRITKDNKKKIELAIQVFEKYVDLKALDDRIITFTPEGITPHMFQYQLVKRAKSIKKHIVLPEGNDDRVLKAAARIMSQDLVELTILGDATEIGLSLKRLGLNLDLNAVHIVNPKTSAHYDDYVQTLYELRKNKNVNLEMATDMMTDVSYFGT